MKEPSALTFLRNTEMNILKLKKLHLQGELMNPSADPDEISQAIKKMQSLLRGEIECIETYLQELEEEDV